MKTRRLIIHLVAVTLVVLCIYVPSAHAQPLEEIFECVLDLAIIAPLPRAICPLVIAAEFADASEVAALEIYVIGREHDIIEEYLLTPYRERQAELERQKKACAQIKSELVRIKNERTARLQRFRAAKEGGRLFSFHGRYELSREPVDWYDGDYDTWLIHDSFGDIPGDDPNGPISAVVTLTSIGYESISVPALNGELTVEGDENSYYNNFPRVSLYFSNFTYEMDSFEIAPGLWTGINYAALNPFGSPPVGEYNFDTEQFEMHLEGIFTNDLYDSSVPVLFFANIFGGVPGEGGDHPDGDFITPDEYFIAGASVAAEVPMIVPLVGDAVELDMPKVMGAHVLEFDADSSTLSLLENTTLEPNADIAMVRYSDGSYAIVPILDESLGAHVVVEPLLYTSESPTGVFNFADAKISICIDAGSGLSEPVLEGFLRNPVLNATSGGFFADLKVTKVSGSSNVLAQIDGAVGPKVMQIAIGAAVYDLVELTKEFTVSGRMPWPEMFYLGVVPDCDPHLIYADFNSDGIVDFKDFAKLTQYWLQDEPLVDIAPLPFGDHIVDKQDLDVLIEKWLGKCE